MPIRKKKAEDIENIKKAGSILAEILRELSHAARPGVSTEELNDEAMRLITERGAEPVLLGYKPTFAKRPYPAAICTSINNVVQHGIPNEKPRILKEGDIINLDLSIGYQGMIADSGVTIGVGNIDTKAKKLLLIAREALYAGIEEARPGNRVGDIGAAMSRVVRAAGFSMVEALCGHGVGYAVHEEPMIPNVAKRGTGPEIEPGMVFAIEPIVNEGSSDVMFDDEGDGYTVTTRDGSRSAHFEHTVIITEDGPIIATE